MVLDGVSFFNEGLRHHSAVAISTTYIKVRLFRYRLLVNKDIAVGFFVLTPKTSFELKLKLRDEVKSGV